MSKLGDYIKTLKNQTDNLRKVVSVKSGIDCSKKSITGCAEIVDSLEVASQEDRYIRPNWYPDIDKIAETVQNITVGSTTYRPYAIYLFHNTQSTILFATNYQDPTDFYVLSGYIAFSDMCDNDINNISESNLIKVGTQHTWDSSKDITNADGSEGVRWCILYSASVPSYAATYTVNEFVPLVEGVLICGAWNNVDSMKSTTLKYWRTLKNVTKIGNPYNDSVLKVIHDGAQGASGVPIIPPCVKEFEFLAGTTLSLNKGYCARQFKLDKPFILSSNSAHNFTQCRIVDLSNMIGCNFTSTVGGPYVETLILNPTLESIQVASAGFFATSTRLQYVRIPSTVTAWTNSKSCFKYATYVELFNDFNISGVDLTGNTIKKLQWLKDLCIWLKDRTGEETGTFIIGTKNIDNASNIYLTFNPNDKRDITFDGVTSETEGAISITAFITNQLNWTLS